MQKFPFASIVRLVGLRDYAHWNYNPANMGNNITYYFRVRSVGSTGLKSDWSDTASYTHYPNPTLPL